MHLIALMMGIALQAPAGSSPAMSKVAVYSDCDPSSTVVAQVPRDSALDIRYSIADAPPTCYYVAAAVNGETVRGFVLDRQMPAIVAFEQARVANEKEAFKAPLPLPPSETPVAPAPAEPAKTVAVKAEDEKKPQVKPPKKMSM
jgi:hypothetical protein